MRTIKFRAWDKDKKEMVKVRNIVWRRMDRGFWTINESNPDIFELMQFTGLTDKNGKEIYEGDIVKKYEISFGKVPVIIEWEDKRAGWSIVSGRRCEVIGNIYENPTAIKQKVGGENALMSL